MEKEHYQSKPYHKVSKFKELRQMIAPQVQKIWNEEQIYLRDQKLIQKDDFQWNIDNLKYVAGVDISFSMQHKDIACSALVIIEKTTLKIVYEDYQFVELDQPYVPGFLAFREIPSLLPLFDKLKERKPNLWPQVILVDGNGIIHQNKFGLACHLGVLLDTPAIGCGKTFFYVDGLSKQKVSDDCYDFLREDGDYIKLVGKSKKQWAAALKTSKNSDQPVFVSVGHKICLETSIDVVLSVSQDRVPQPIRLADRKSRAKIRELNKNFSKFQKQIKQYKMVFCKPE